MRAVTSWPLTSRCVRGSPGVSGCAQTYSGQRPRSWARPGGTFGRELLDAGKRKRAVHRTAGSWIPMPAALCEQLVRLRKITGGSTVWPTHGLRDPQGAHENVLISGYRVGLTTPRGSPRLPGLRMSCRMQDGPRINQLPTGWCGAGLRRPPTDLRCTYGGPFIYPRDGTDNGERSKRDPLPAQR